MPNHAGLQRLLDLAVYLRSVPEERFNMQFFWDDAHADSELRDIAGRNDKTTQPLSLAELDSHHPSCGTSACALGWATNLWPEHLRLSRGGMQFRGSPRQLWRAYFFSDRDFLRSVEISNARTGRRETLRQIGEGCLERWYD